MTTLERMIDDYLLREPDEVPHPRCPFCGREPEQYGYYDRHGGCLGCDECVKRVDVWDDAKEDAPEFFSKE